MKKTVKLVKKSLAGAIFATSMFTATMASAGNPPPTIKADAPNRYVVKSGDNLWDISGKYLESPYRWKEIWATNQQIKNPHLIYPGDVLILCVVQDKTLVGIDTGEGCAGVVKQVTGQVVAPQTVQVRPANSHVPTVALANIRHWLDKTVIVNPDDYEETPYVLASKNGNLLTAKGDRIYVRGLPLIPGQRYGIYRKGKPYIDPLTKEVIGLEVTQIATGLVSKVEANNVSSLQLLDNYDTEVREGDRVFVELGNFVQPVFNLEPAHVDRGGQIIRVMGTIGNAAKHSVVAINLGTENGANPGDVLTVYQHGALVRDIYDNDTPVRLPSEAIGNLMIFKTFNKISYAYILDAEKPIPTGSRLLPPQSL